MPSPHAHQSTRYPQGRAKCPPSPTRTTPTPPTPLLLTATTDPPHPTLPPAPLHPPHHPTDLTISPSPRAPPRSHPSPPPGGWHAQGRQALGVERPRTRDHDKTSPPIVTARRDHPHAASPQHAHL